MIYTYFVFFSMFASALVVRYAWSRSKVLANMIVVQLEYVQNSI